MSDRYAEFAALSIEREGKLLRITLDSPPMNGLTPEQHHALARIWHVIDQDPEVYCVVLTGAGERAFCAGGNPAAMIENWGDRNRWHVGIAEARAIVVGMLRCSKPIISRINGHAMGAGASIALSADITIITNNALIGDPHVNVGLTCGDGGALLWPHLMGLVEARRHLLTGEPLRGSEAYAKGLVTASTEAEDLDAAVQHYIDLFLAKPPIALQTTKIVLNRDILEKAERHMDEMLRLETLSWESSDHPEAVRAMMEKRAPRFQNR